MTWGFVTCGPNEALVVSGCCHTKPLLVPGGRAFVWPSIQCVQRISLNTMTLQVESKNVYTSQGVPISVTGVAQVKIQAQNEEMLMTACEQFLGKTEDEIQHIALVTLEGHQRAIMGSMSVEGYLKSLGMARTAEVKRDARVGEAEAKKDARIKEAMAEEEKMAARFVNDTEIAKARRDFEIKKATYDAEVETKRAEAELAFELQAAKTKQRIKEEQMKIQVIERSQEIKVQEQEVLRRKKELESNVNRPVEAEKYRIEKLAAANKKRLMIEAEAEAEVIRLKGEAEAAAIASKARAEVEIMTKKAEAWKDYREAAVIDMILESLPKVAAEVAAPLSQTKRVTMVSSGNGELGAAKLTGEILTIVARVPEMVKSLTGVDILKHKVDYTSMTRRPSTLSVDIDTGIEHPTPGTPSSSTSTASSKTTTASSRLPVNVGMKHSESKMKLNK
uniref:Flotillin-1 n=1 Tax=Cacopsylla melanoneura TaxID=428564 RepID=A0A8D9APA1_9HEMI